MKKRSFWFYLAAAILLLSSVAFMHAPNPQTSVQYVGQIQLFPFAFTPSGWKLCEGQLLPIDDTTAPLAQLIGNKFGGDGQKNFALPNLKGKEPLPGMRYYIAVSGVFPSPY